MLDFVHDFKAIPHFSVNEFGKDSPSYVIRRLMDNMKLLLICILQVLLYVFYYYHIASYSLGSIFYQCMYGFIPV
jgi:lipopolysaccharide/colanic/teichoic acid biosynthesis glycosyltransferase